MVGGGIIMKETVDLTSSGFHASKGSQFVGIFIQCYIIIGALITLM